MDAEVKRKSNFEWLRILAMGMIITLHYMFKGEIVQPPVNAHTATNYMAWLITAMSICAVNIYVLISGYFLTETTFKFRRLAGLLIQILEYSLIVTLIMIVTGQVSVSELTIYDWMGYVFPIGTEEYWFITAYMLMYLTAPLLSAGAKSLDKKQLQTIIHVLILFTVIEKSILPMVLPWDGAGYDVIWFIVLFLVAAYIRIYGLTFLEGHTVRAWIMYIASVVMTCAVGMSGNILEDITGRETFGHYSAIVWDYNFIFTLTSAIGLFYVFKNAHFKEESKLADIARKLGGLTLGVYLLHEHPLIRYRWHKWFHVGENNSLAMMLINWVICVLIVYAAGLAVEFIRSTVHGLLSSNKNNEKGN